MIKTARVYISPQSLAFVLRVVVVPALLASISRRKVAALLMIVALATVGVGAALASSGVISNVLKLGPTQHTPESVQLTLMENLPSSMKTREERRARFDIQNTGAAVSGGLLKVRLTASGTSITDPSIVQMRFKDPDTGNEGTVNLSATGGSLESTLKSNWSVPQSYSGISELRLSFNGNAPAASYSLEVWIESTSGSGSSSSTSTSTNAQTHNVQATDDRRFLPQNITVKAGDTVRWTNVGQTPHTITFSDSSIPNNRFFDGGQTYTFTFTKAGTFNYICEFHKPEMVGSITAQQ